MELDNTIKVVDKKNLTNPTKHSSTDLLMMAGNLAPSFALIGWDKTRIYADLISVGVKPDTAREITDIIENKVINGQHSVITTGFIRGLIDAELIKRGLNDCFKKHTDIRLNAKDLTAIITNAANENSNSTHSPESINLTIAEIALKQYAMDHVFSSSAAEAHMSGDLHIHDAGFIVRPYCSGNSLEYIKKYGLSLPTITSESGPAKHSEVLIGHQVKMATGLQSYFAGAIGWDAVNMFYAPFFTYEQFEKRMGDLFDPATRGTKAYKDEYKKWVKQNAQMLIFEFNQLAGARGSLHGDETIMVYDKQESTLSAIPISKFVGKYLKEQDKEETRQVTEDRYYAISFDSATGITELQRIYAVIKHKNNHNITKLKTENGAEVVVTDNHSLFQYDATGNIIKSEPKNSPKTILTPFEVPQMFNISKIDVLSILSRFNAIEHKNGMVSIDKNTQFTLPKYLKLTPEFLRLLGYYVSTGMADMRVVFQVSHKQVIQDIEECVKKVFNIPIHHSKEHSVFFGDSIHAALFASLCGRLPEAKQVPAYITLGSKDIIREFLSAYLSEAGLLNTSKFSCITTSKTLASQVAMMFHRLGIIPDQRSVVSGTYINKQKSKTIQKQHKVSFDRAFFDKFHLINKDKDCIRKKSLESSIENSYDQTSYDFSHVRAMIINVFNDRSFIQSLGGKITISNLTHIMDEISNRMKQVNLPLLLAYKEANKIELIQAYINQENLPFETVSELKKLLNSEKLLLSSKYIQPENVLRNTPYNAINIIKQFSAMNLPIKISPRNMNNPMDTDGSFDIQQTAASFEVYNTAVDMIITRYKDMKKILEASIRCLSLLPSKVKSIDLVSNEEYVYDIGVEKNENFLTGGMIFAHNSQVVFSDFNLYFNIPAHYAETPALLPGGLYGVRKKDGSVITFQNQSEALNEEAETGGTLLKYKHFERESKAFLYALFETYQEGDKDGRPFFFPKPLLHINEEMMNTKGIDRFMNLACSVASKQGSTYFVFDRGDGVSVSQCCRLKVSLDEYEIQKTAHPEKLRFAALQNVTLNLPRAAYKAKGNDTVLFKELDRLVSLAIQAHLDKKRYINGLMSLGTEGPLSLLTKSADGEPYMDLNSLTYLIGLLGLNEAVLFHTGEELHESRKALKFGLRIIAHLAIAAEKMGAEAGIPKTVLEESPAESSGYRLAKLDLIKFPSQTKSVIRGNPDSGDCYYTNSVHLAYDSPVDYIERIQKQSLFSPLIKAGSIIHCWLGEQEPSPKAIANLVYDTFKNTQAEQIVFSPEFTMCEDCATTSRGLNAECNDCGSYNTYWVTRIVGYYSKVQSWNQGKQAELIDRARGLNE